MTPIGYEINFDGIIGPTYNFSGLAFGNIASMSHEDEVSNPKLAALQGLEKMKLLKDLGLWQGVLPPHERPHIPSLRALGFSGPDRVIPEKVYNTSPKILKHFCSASPAWVANSAIITPSVDSIDNKVNITPANLYFNPHRTIETEFHEKIYQLIFPNTLYFKHNPPLPLGKFFGDEGAANHCRFCSEQMHQGVHLFVYGKSTFDDVSPRTQEYPPRQSIEASQANARVHKIFPKNVLFLAQNPEAIDEGVFHNDVIVASNQNLIFYHEKAFEDTVNDINKLRQKVEEICETELIAIEVPEKKVSLAKAVDTYLFNSQIITNQEGTMTIIAPRECQKAPSVYNYIDQLTKDPESPIRDVHFVDLSESMHNGGGPACLRIRAVLNQNEFNAVNPNFLLTEKLYAKLSGWIDRNYRDRLSPKDLADPDLIDETQRALDELTRILDTGPIYSFQR